MQSKKAQTLSLNCSKPLLEITEIHETRDSEHKDKNYFPHVYSQTRKRASSIQVDTLSAISSTTEHKKPRLTKHALWKLPSMIETFDSFPPSFQTEFILNLISKSSKNTLQLMNSWIRPKFEQDFFLNLPPEISQIIIGYLDAFSLSRASCVCKKWKQIIDNDSNAWTSLILKDGYKLTDPITHKPTNAYKTLYGRHHTLKQNWVKGRAEHVWFKGHAEFVVTCLQFDDQRIVSGADDSHVNIYDTATGEKKITLEGHEGGVWALQYVGQTLVTGSTDRRVRVWDMETGKCTHIFTGHTSTIRCLLITKPSPGLPAMIVTGSRDSTLRVWSLPDIKGRPYHGQGPNTYFRHALLGHSNSVRAIAANGHTVVSGSYDHTVRVWDIRSGRLVHLMEGHTDKVYSVVIDAERNRCMSGSLDSSVRIWSLSTGECLKRLEGHAVLVGLLGLTNQYLVSAATDSILRVWSPETGVCQHALSGHGNSITCFQHDNEKVISGSEGGLKMWDIKTGKFMRDLITDVDGVWRVAFDNRRCIAAVQRQSETSFRILDFGAYNL